MRFQDADIEAAARALYAEACRQRGFRNDFDEVWENTEFRESCMLGMGRALEAAVFSLEAREK